MTTAPDGSIYVAGTARVSAFFSYDSDIFVRKLTPEGDRALWTTFLGGVRPDEALDIGVDRNGSAVILGGTCSILGIPALDMFGIVKPIPADTRGDFCSPQRLVLARLSPDGQDLLFHTVIESDRSGFAALAVDPSSGDIAVTAAGSSGLATPGAWRTQGYGPFVTRFSSQGQRRWTSYLLPGGFNQAQAMAVTFDPQGNLWVAGYAPASLSGGIPPGIFVVRVAPDGRSGQDFPAILPGDSDRPAAIAWHDGSIYLAGETSSTRLPAAPGWRSASAGGRDGFLLRLRPDGQVTAATFLGGSGEDRVLSLAVDAARSELLIGGATASRDFPLAGPVQSSPRVAALVSRSGNQGATWSARDTGVDPGNPTAWTYMSAEPGGRLVLRSGNSWYRATRQAERWEEIPVDVRFPWDGPCADARSEPRIVYCGALSRSDDGGATWHHTTQRGSFQKLVVHPADPDTVFTMTDSGDVGRIRWGGSHQELIRAGSSAALLADRLQPGTLFAGNRFPGGPVLRSSDNGDTWQTTGSGIPDSAWIAGLAQHPIEKGVLYAWVSAMEGGPVTARGVYRSADAGDSWVRMLAANDLRGIAADPAEPGLLYAWGAFGLLRSGDEGATWEPLPAPAGSGGITDLRPDPTQPGALWAIASGTASAFVARMPPSLDGLPFSSYLGALGPSVDAVAPGHGGRLVAALTGFPRLPPVPDAVPEIHGGAVAVLRQISADCRYEVTTEVLAFGPGPGTAHIRVLAPGGCPWTVESDQDWLRLSTAAGPLAGLGEAVVTAAPNAGGQRSATVTIAGQSIRVWQSAADCGRRLPLKGVALPKAGGEREIDVQLEEGCALSLRALAPWVRMDPPLLLASGRLRLETDAWQGYSDRTTYLEMPGALPVSALQPGACQFEVPRTAETIDARGGADRAFVALANPSDVFLAGGCRWNFVQESGSDWLAASSYVMANRLLGLRFTPQPNLTGESRTSRLLLAGHPVTITQLPVECSYALDRTETHLGLAGGSFTVRLDTSDARCAWTLETSPWITASPAAGQGSATLSFRVDPLAEGGRQGGISLYHGARVAAPFLPSNVIAVRVTQAAEPPPRISLEGIVNGAGFHRGPISPGQIVSIFGENLGPEPGVVAQPDPEGFYPLELAGVRVHVGTQVRLLYVGRHQINFVAPYGLSLVPANVAVVRDGFTVSLSQVPVALVSPALFQDPEGNGAILNQDGTVNSEQNPAAPGSIVMLFGTGHGYTDPHGTDGRLVTGDPPRPLLPTTVEIAGQPARVTYSGSAPGLVFGVLQVNAEIPADVSGRVPVRFALGDAASPPVFLWVR